MLPAATILVTAIGGWILTMRNTMITTLAEDYVRMGRAKGLSNRRIMMGYAARNAFLPNLSGFAMSLGFVIAGTILVEYVFNYPGLGYMFYTATTATDYPLLQALFLLVTDRGARLRPALRLRGVPARPARSGEGVAAMSAILVATSPATGTPPSTRRRGGGLWRAIRGNRKAMCGLALFGLFVVLALAPHLFVPWEHGDPQAVGTTPLLHPSAKHWLGTTGLGQDVYTAVGLRHPRIAQ